MKYKFFITTFLFVGIISSTETIKSIKLNKLHANPSSEAQIVTFIASKDGFTIKEVSIEVPKERILKKLRLITDEDKYAVKVFGEDDKFLFSIGIGNPLYATYEHIGYEDRKYMGGPVSRANIEIAIPMGVEATSFIISKRDISGKFNDLQELLLQ